MGATTTIDNPVLSDLAELVDRDPSCEDRPGLRELADRERRVRAWLDAYGVKVARRTRQLAEQERPSAPPTENAVIASLLDSGCRSGKEAKTATTREGVCADLPGFEEALESGDVSGAHLDALGHLLKGLTDEERLDLRDRAGELLDHASSEFVETFGKTAREIVNQVRDQHRPDAAVDELERQRKASKLTEWIDRTSGMHKTLLELDPVRAASLRLAISANLNRLRQQPGNAGRPYDELKVEAFLAAVTNPPGDTSLAPRVPEVIVLIDWDTLKSGVRNAGGVCELSDGTPLPVATVRQMACAADIIPVVLGGEGQVLDVGRSRRLATTAQRTALRAMYSTCAEPGCDMPIDECRAHHITEWDPTRNAGNTDLNNLLPVCEPTHARIHQHGWNVKIIGNHQRMIWTRPDGTIIYDGPAPNRKPRSNPTNNDGDDPDDHKS
jgi:hypothetical protein